MTNSMTVHFLFYLGIIIPAAITLVLFVIFLYFLHKHRVRKEIMTKKHDPHRRFTKRNNKEDSKGAKLIESEKYWNSNQSCHSGEYAEHNEAFDASPDLPANESKTMYNTFHDSGMSDLSETQYKFESDRPVSQASTDSEDSGFRSSRSGQYIHSAQNSAGNEKDTQIFKPILNEKENSNTLSARQKSDEMTRNYGIRHSYPLRKKKSSFHKHIQRDISINEIETDMTTMPISTIARNPFQAINPPSPRPTRHSSDSNAPMSYFQSQHPYGPIKMTPLLSNISKSLYMSTNTTSGVIPTENQHKHTVTTAMVHRPNIDLRQNTMSFSVV